MRNGFLWTKDQIINKSQRLADKPFRYANENTLASKTRKRLEDFVLDPENIETLKQFNTLALLPDKPKTKPENKTKVYNKAITKNELMDYFLDPIIRKAFHLYIEFLLDEATNENIVERLSISLKNSNELDIDEFRNFLKDMCMEVTKFENARKIVDGNVLTLIENDDKRESLNIKSNILERINLVTETSKKLNERKSESTTLYNSDNSAQGCISEAPEINFADFDCDEDLIDSLISKD